MQQPVAQGREDDGRDKKKCQCAQPMTLHTPAHCWYCGGDVKQSDPCLEYVQAMDSDDPRVLNQVMSKYGYNDTLMIAFLAMHKAFDSAVSFTQQLYHYRATGQRIGE